MLAPGRDRSAQWMLVVVAAVALATRGSLWAQAGKLPQFSVPVLDSRFYVETGRTLASGGALPPRPCFMSPGYTAFVALCARIASDAQLAVVAIQIVLDVASCVLVAWLAWRYLGLVAGWTAGLLLALHGAQILFTTRVLDATLGAFLVALLAVVVGRLDDDRRPWRLGLAGLLVGLLALLRSTALVFVLPILVGAWWFGRREPFGLFARRAAAFLLGVLLPIAPVTLRNAVAGGELVLLTSSGGVNFFIGNAPQTDGRFCSLNNLPLAPGAFVDDPTNGQFEESTRRYAEAQTHRKLTAAETSAYYAGLARAAIAAEPAAAAGRFLRKLWLFANAFETPQVDNLYFLARYVPWLRPLAETSRLLWPLAFFGMLFVAARSRPPLIVALLGTYAVTIACFFVTDRYRLWITPIAAVLAGGGVARLFEVLRRGSLPSRALHVGALAAIGIACNLNPALFHPGRAADQPARDRGGLFRPAPDYLDFRAQHNNMAARLRDSGALDASLAECEAGLALAPDDPTLHLNLVLTLGRLGSDHYLHGRYAQARPLLERWTREAPRDAEAWNTLGAALLKLEQPEEGLAAIGRAVELAPGELKYRYNLGLALVREGRFAEAIPPLDLALAARPEDASLLTVRAEAALGIGDRAGARARLERVLAKNPNHARAKELLRRCDQ